MRNLKVGKRVSIEFNYEVKHYWKKVLFFLCIDRPKLSQRIKMITQKLFTILYTKLVNLNLFPLRDFGSTISRVTAKRLGQLATRLYIVLLTVGLIILVFYTIIQPQLIKKTFDRPSLDVYERLLRDHSETLQCPCSSISLLYDQFITIEPLFHPVRSHTNHLLDLPQRRKHTFCQVADMIFRRSSTNKSKYPFLVVIY